MKEYRNEYMSSAWFSRDELTDQLNRFTNEGWLADTHRLDSQQHSGWTIYRRTVMIIRPLLERSIKLDRLYSILNRLLEPGSDVSRKFDAEIKESVRQEGDQ